MLDINFSCIVFTFFALRSIANHFALGTPNLINTTKNFDITFPGTSSTNDSNDLEDLIGCFQQAPPHESQLSRTNFIDCFSAQEQIAAHDPRRPIIFRRNNDTAFILPNKFVYRTCTIFLDMVSADDEDFFYVAEIRDAAIDTARKCTSISRALGGKAIVGPRKSVEVFVFGRP